MSNQARLHRVLMDVRNRLKEMVFISHKAIPILPMPDPLASPRIANLLIGVCRIANLLIGVSGLLPQSSLSRYRSSRFAFWEIGVPESLPMEGDSSRGELLPGRHDLGDGPAIDRLEKHMHVIGHDHPGDQAVALSVEEVKRILNHRGDRRIAENARPVASIDPRLDSLATFDILPMRRKPPEFLLQAIEDLPGQTIRQVERHMLSHARPIEMRQIPTPMPSRPPSGTMTMTANLRTANLLIGTSGNVTLPIGVSASLSITNLSIDVRTRPRPRTANPPVGLPGNANLSSYQIKRSTR